MRSCFYDRCGNGYTDLALERHARTPSAEGVEYFSRECDVGIWETVRIYSAAGEEGLGRPMGRYHTLTTGRLDLLAEDEIEDVCEEIARALCLAVDAVGCIPERILTVGLGNARLTPDSLGTRAAETVKPTLHVKSFDERMFSALECSEMAVLCPGVPSDTGVDSIEIIRGVSKRLCPDLMIVIDALATEEEGHLGSTVQLTDAGLSPGGGVGNSRHALTEETLGIPIISVGIPTVIDSRAFRKDDGGRNIGESMLVSPREIDEIVDVGARIIGGAINQAFGISAY